MLVSAPSACRIHVAANTLVTAWSTILGGGPAHPQRCGMGCARAVPQPLPPRRPVDQEEAVHVPVGVVARGALASVLRAPGAVPWRWPPTSFGALVAAAAGPSAFVRRGAGVGPSLPSLAFLPVPIGAATGIHARLEGDVRARMQTPIPFFLGIAVGAATGIHARLAGDVRARLQTPIPFFLGIAVGAATGIHARLAGDVRARLQTPIPFFLGIAVGAATGVHARHASDVRARMQTPIPFFPGIAVGAATGIHARFTSDVRARLHTPIPFILGILVGAATGIHARYDSDVRARLQAPNSSSVPVGIDPVADGGLARSVLGAEALHLSSKVMFRAKPKRSSPRPKRKSYPTSPVTPVRFMWKSISTVKPFLVEEARPNLAGHLHGVGLGGPPSQFLCPELASVPCAERPRSPVRLILINLDFVATWNFSPSS